MRSDFSLNSLIESVSTTATIDTPPPMPATVSKPIPRILSPILFFLLPQPVHDDVIENTNL